MWSNQFKKYPKVIEYLSKSKDTMLKYYSGESESHLYNSTRVKVLKYLMLKVLENKK